MISKTRKGMNNGPVLRIIWVTFNISPKHYHSYILDNIFFNEFKEGIMVEVNIFRLVNLQDMMDLAQMAN